ncbi:MAG: M20/M25/M40 family metallo-hydrolase [Candidatus Krumholzibacteriia bacterium]
MTCRWTQCRLVPSLARLVLPALLGAPASVLGQPAPRAAERAEAVERVRAYRDRHQRETFEELLALLAIPNVASDRDNIRKNARRLVRMLRQRGAEARLLEAEDSPAAVYGHLQVPGARRTVVFYAHYDGQPADPERWDSPPWNPVLRDSAGQELPRSALHGDVDGEWRIQARSASDDKSPIVAMLTAIDALRDAGIPPSVNLKFFFEGEEEAGSPHLEAILRRHAALLDADLWLFCDGPVHPSGRQQVVFGVRGVVDLEMTVYGALRSLHSGHYGNWAPNPIALLTDCLASMRDGDGQVHIDGFYDDLRPRTRAEERALAEIPAVEEQLRHELALARTEAGGARLMERILLPAMNLRGIRSGQVELEAKNAVPTEAKASIDFRLVPDQTPAKLRERVEAHIRKQGFHIVEDVPDLQTRRQHAKIVRLRWGAGYPALRTSMELPVSRAVLQAADEAVGGRVIRIPSLGGSLPLYLFREILDTPLIVVPMVNHDNNQHAPNENLRIQNFWNGIEMYANLMARLGELW